jgi:hypothetical protein
MTLTKGYCPVEEIGELRCRIIEGSCDNARARFLKDLLEYNGYKVVVAANPPAEEGGTGMFKVGVTELLFNPVIRVYEKKLKTPDGRIVTPAIWDQREEVEHLPYWVEGLEVSQIYREELNQR